MALVNILIKNNTFTRETSWDTQYTTSWNTIRSTSRDTSKLTSQNTLVTTLTTSRSTSRSTQKNTLIGSHTTSRNTQRSTGRYTSGGSTNTYYSTTWLGNPSYYAYSPGGSWSTFKNSLIGWYKGTSCYSYRLCRYADRSGFDWWVNAYNGFRNDGKGHSTARQYCWDGWVDNQETKECRKGQSACYYDHECNICHDCGSSWEYPNTCRRNTYRTTSSTQYTSWVTGWQTSWTTNQYQTTYYTTNYNTSWQTGLTANTSWSTYFTTTFDTEVLTSRDTVKTTSVNTEI